MVRTDLTIFLSCSWSLTQKTLKKGNTYKKADHWEDCESLLFKSTKDLNWVFFLLLKSNCHEKWICEWCFSYKIIILLFQKMKKAFFFFFNKKCIWKQTN